MKVTEISTTFQDYPDEESIAVIAYFRGCSHSCPGCQNIEYQNYFAGSEGEISIEALYSRLVEMCEKWRTNKVVLSGGDPFYVHNRVGAIRVIDLLRENGYEVCVYTGFKIDSVKTFYENTDMERPNFFKCGVYDESRRRKEWGKTNDYLVWVSPNQNLYDSEYHKLSEAGVYYWKKP